MFFKHDDHSRYADLSVFVRDLSEWKIGALREFEFPLDTSAIAFNPVSSLLAVGTGGGMIHLHGGPGVETRLLLPEAISVRFLQFGIPTDRLVCLDSRHQLHIWDLSPLGSPKHMAMVRWDPVTFMVLSPSHDHIFLAMSNGEIRTYDLACMRESPYIIPNSWRFYEEQMLRSGAVPVISQGHRLVELLPHPRNLNLLFVAYEGGVVLLDLKEHGTVRAFELVLSSGASGGIESDSQGASLPPRRSPVTGISIHPSGHFFAAGHADGTIAFWAVEDAGQPLLVRTLDSTDVNNVDVEVPEARLSDATTHRPPAREPIFKLSWSGFLNSEDPRGGDTVLTVLGGFGEENVFGLTVLLFPPFNPGDPPAISPSAAQDRLDPFMATAMRRSLDERCRFTYSTNGPVQDFCLIPRDNPHFNYTYDPYAILILVDAGQNARILESREFPPPFFTPLGDQLTSESAAQDEENLRDLTATLKSLSTTGHPQLVGLPFELSGNNFSVDTHRMFVLSKEVHLELTKGTETPNKRPKVQLSGGTADIESYEGKTSKYQPHRILVVPSRNLTISFFDMSNQLLQGDSPLRHDFPEAIDALEIDLQPALDILDSEQAANEAHHPIRTILSVHLAIETTECVIALSTGEILVYRPRSAQATRPISGIQAKQLRNLSHVTTESWRRLSPYFALRVPERGPIQAVSISEIGFLAASLADGSLFIVDMRGPTILHGPIELGDGPSRSAGRASTLYSHTETINGVANLTWTISGLDKDPKARIRLVAVRTSGNMEAYTVTQSGSGYILEGPISLGKVPPHPLRDGTFVVTSKTGAFCKADRSRFAAIYQAGDQMSEPVVLVTASAGGARSFANINGQRLGKADWSNKYGDVIGVQIVERMGSKVFVAYTNKSSLHVYSLPHLEHIHTIPASSTPFSSISIDENGDFVSFQTHPSFGLVHSATYGTLFNFRRACELPVVDFVSNKGTVPPQPQPVPMGPPSLLGSWLKFNQTMSGQQLDELLAGPERPSPVKRARDQTHDNAGDTVSGSSLVASASAMQSNIYNQLTSALSERGQMLGELEENFKALEQGSKDMVSQAKRLAAENTAKSWFRF